jgi:aubergine-like protein
LSLENDRTDNFLKNIRNNLSQTTQMVIVVLPSNRKDRYDSIKKLCCVELPVPSQCILQRTLSKKQNLMSVATKVAMQLNCKLGGELWAVEVPVKNLMVVGIDSYHDSASRGRSVGGFIASTNNSLTRYYSQCMFQHTGQELADNLKVCMTAALKNYHDINKCLPERILVYRDGVGDGQV